MSGLLPRPGDFAFALTDWQRQSYLDALDGATYEIAHGSRSGYGGWIEKRPIRVKVRRTTWCGAKVWMFDAGGYRAAEAARRITEYVAHRWFVTGEQVVFAADMLDGTPKKSPAHVVAIYAGTLYIEDELHPAPRKADGSPDLYHTRFVGPWWLDRA